MVARADMSQRTLKAIWFGSLLFLLFSTCTVAQTNSPQAVSVLTQALNASGSANASNPVQSLTATGTITFYWAGKPVQAPATLRLRGKDQFRLDATLPDGPWSVAINRDAGVRKEPDGKRTDIPLHNTISQGGSPFPYLQIAAALNDSTMSLTDSGLVASAGRELRQVRASRKLPEDQDPGGIISKLSQTDYFVDPATNLVVKVADITHPIETLTKDYPRETELDGYTVTNGVSVPMLVRQKIAGQTVWELHISAIDFNTNLTDVDFSLQ